jgi:hypothetical protein
MATIIESYKRAVKKNKEGTVMGVIRTMFPDVRVETFLETKTKKLKK